MPLVPIRGDEGNSSVLSANQALRKRHDRRTLSMYFPMEVQEDSLEECSESPDLPEPLYADFGLQVLKSLETSFLSSSIAETQEVPDHPPTHLPWRPDIWITSSSRKRSGWREAPWRLWSRAAGAGGGDGSSAAGSPDSDAAGQPAARRRQTLQGVCTPLQELSSAFIKKTMKEEQEEEKRPYDV